jgi:hypothetical protein
LSKPVRLGDMENANRYPISVVPKFVCDQKG